MPKLEGGADESWLQTAWRPAMAWQYFVVCIFDFIIFPILNAVYFAAIKGNFQPWQPMTLEGGGLYHMAMGAIIGVAVWQRTNEKIAAFQSTPFGGGTSVERTSVSEKVTSTSNANSNTGESSRAD